MHSERTQGFAADPDYWKGEVFAYVGLPQNLKDLKDLNDLKDLKDLTKNRVFAYLWLSQNLKDRKACPPQEIMRHLAPAREKGKQTDLTKC